MLKEDGIEKLEQKSPSLLDNSRQKSQTEQERVEDKAERVPTRKIMPSLENGSGLVDVTGIGIRADNRKMTSKRKSWEAAQDESNYVSFV